MTRFSKDFIVDLVGAPALYRKL